MHAGNIECTITGARRYFSDSPQGGLEVLQPCTLRQLLMMMQKLERSYKLSTIVIILGFNLSQAPSTVNSSNLILCQVFPLYDIDQGKK